MMLSNYELKEDFHWKIYLPIFLFVYLIFQLLSKIAFGSIKLLQASKCYFKILRSFSST